MVRRTLKTRGAAYLVAVAFVLTIAVATELMITNTAYGNGPEDLDVQAQVGGNTVAIVQGTVIATGEVASIAQKGVWASTNSGAPVTRCQVPDFQISGQLSKDFAQGVVEVTLTEECTLQVTSIQQFPASVSPSSASTANNGDYVIDGWAESAFIDFVGIVLAGTRSEISYWVSDNGSVIGNAHNIDYDCNHFGLSGWVEDSCELSRSSPSATSVYAKTTGEFHNPRCNWVPGATGSCRHTQWSKFRSGTVYWQGTFSCDYTRPLNTYPVPGAIWSCRGGQD